MIDKYHRTLYILEFKRSQGLQAEVHFYLTEKAVEIENPISVKEHERERYNSNPTMFYKNRFWNRRLDGIVINKNHRRLYILEFKWSSDTNEDFLGVKEDEATEQHKSVIEALKAAAPD